MAKDTSSASQPVFGVVEAGLGLVEPGWWLND